MPALTAVIVSRLPRGSVWPRSLRSETVAPVAVSFARTWQAGQLSVIRVPLTRPVSVIGPTRTPRSSTVQEPPSPTLRRLAAGPVAGGVVAGGVTLPPPGDTAPTACGALVCCVLPAALVAVTEQLYPPAANGV